LATLGDATKNRNNPIFCGIAQELSLVAVAGIISLDFANVNTALGVLTLFCRLDHFININNICCIAMKRSSLQNRVSKFMPKKGL
jgi:hypothetical protein